MQSARSGCGSELVRRIRAGLCDRCLPLPFDLAFDHCRPAVGALPVVLPGADDALVDHHQQDDWRRSARTVPASREQNTRAKINWYCSGKRDRQSSRFIKLSDCRQPVRSCDRQHQRDGACLPGGNIFLTSFRRIRKFEQLLNRVSNQNAVLLYWNGID